MAVYPPGPTRMVDLSSYGANSAPTDRFWIASAAVGFALGSAADRYITPNDFLAEITRNITDVSVQFGDGVGAAVSAASKGKIRYNATTQTYQVSKNAAAYVNLLAGSGVATRVAFWTATDELGSNANFYWDNVNARLGVGVGSTPAAPIDVLAESVSAIAQQWRPNTGTMRAVIKLDTGPETFFGTTTAHNLHLITSNIQRLSIEATSGNVGINKITAIAAQLQVVANAATTKGLIVQSAPTTSVNIAEFYNDASLRYVFANDGTLTLGLAGASGATGMLTFSVNGQANTQSLRGGTAPATTNQFLWPNADPTLGQALTASAPAAGIVTLSWTTISAGTTINPTDTVVPYRLNATTFADSPIARPGAGQITVTGTQINTSAAAAAFAVGPNGDTNPVFRVVANVTSSVTGLSITGNAMGSGTDLIVLSSAVSEGLRVLAKGQTSFFFGNTPNGATTSRTGVGNNGGDQLGFFINTGVAWAINPSSFFLGRNGGTLGFGVGAAPLSDALQSGFIHLAGTGNLRLTGASNAAGGLLIAPSTASISGNFTVLPDNAATATTVTVARLGVNSTGSPTAPSGAAIGFGPTLSWSAETTTAPDIELGRTAQFWLSPTNASRTSSMSWSLTNNAVLTEAMRLAVPAVASPFCLNLFDGTAPNVWTAGSYGAKLYLIGSALPAVGVCAHFGNTTIDTAQWQFLRGRGTNASPTAVQNGDVMGDLEWWGQTNTATNNVIAGARIRVAATETWSAGNNGCQMIFYVSNNAGTITDRMYLTQTGTLRIGATSGGFNTTTLLQIGNYGSWNTDIVAAIYTGANATRGLEIIGTPAQTGQLFRIFADSNTPDFFSISGIGLGSIIAGTGPVQANIGGVLFVNSGTANNTSTTETTLMSYTLQDDSLAVNNSYIRWENAGTFVASINNKRIRAYIGATLIFDSGALGFSPVADSNWTLNITIVRTGSSAQKAAAAFTSNDAALRTDVQLTTGAENLTTDLLLKVTGQGGASDEIIQKEMIVDWSPQPNS